MEGWYCWLISMLLIVYVFLPTKRYKNVLLVSWLQQAYHAATVIRQMQRLALNSGQQQQQQESTGSIGPSSDNPMQYREQSQVSYNQHTEPSPPPSSNLSNWSKRKSLLTMSSLMFMNLTSHSIPVTPADYSPPLYMCNKRFKLWNNIRTVRSIRSLLRQLVSQLRKQRKHKKSWVLGTIRITRAIRIRERQRTTRCSCPFQATGAMGID